MKWSSWHWTALFINTDLNTKALEVDIQVATKLQTLSEAQQMWSKIGSIAGEEWENNVCGDMKTYAISGGYLGSTTCI